MSIVSIIDRLFGIPSYCERCGARVVIREGTIGFDRYTGKRRTEFYIECSDKACEDDWPFMRERAPRPPGTRA